jgi:hypothetical protein
MRDPIVIAEPANREKWVLDPSRTIVLVPDHPNRMASTALMLWLAKRFENIQPFGKYDVVAMRNTLVRDMRHKRFDFVAMFDNDMHPTATSDILWESTADINCVQCEHGCGGCWARPDDFHCNGFWFTRKVLIEIPLPWFMKTYSPDGCEQVGCSCNYFREKALAAGFTIQRGGWMNHGASE